MAYLHELITSMRAHSCVGFTLDSTRGLIFQRPDGEELSTALRLTATQICQLLAEVVPAQHRARGEPYRFKQLVDGIDHEIAVAMIDGAPVIRVAMIAEASAPSPPPAAPRGAEAHAAASPRQNQPSTLPWEPFSSLDRLLHQPLPAVLRMSERAERIAAGVVGMALGLAVALGLATATPPDSAFHQMFDPHEPTSAVPALICCFFFWASLICLVRWLRVRALEVLSPTALVLQIAQLVERQGAPAAATAIERAPAVAATPLLRRSAAVLRQWNVEPGLHNADIVLRQHVAHDEEAVHRGFHLVRTFVWALPVLGLIGTVIGIALAVGGFASFLGGSIDDVRVVKQNLVGVTGGLSFAFLITLLGLFTSLVVMLVSSALQTREERLYGRVQHDLTEHLLPVLQLAAPDAPARDRPAAATAAWEASVPRIVEAIEAAARAAIDSRERERRDEIVSFTRAVTEASKEVATQAAVIRDHAKALVGLAETTRSAIAQQAALQTSVRAVAESLTEMSSAVNTLQLGTSSMASMRSSLEQLAPILQSFRGPFVFQAVPVEERRVDGHLRSRG